MLVGDLGRFLILLAIGCFALGALGWGFGGASERIRRFASIGLVVVLLGIFAVAAAFAGNQFYYKLPFGLLGGVAAIFLAFEGWLALTHERFRVKVPARAFTAGSVALFATMICLGVLFVNDQFHYAYIWPRASVVTELKYKIAGIWSGQEGSFLLWGCMSAIFGLLAVRATGIYRRWFTVCFSFFLMALALILAYESPFRIDPVTWEAARLGGKALPLIPLDGAGMTPSLQNYWVVIHPPTIFAGFGSLTVLFCWAMSAMLTGNAKDWAAMVRPWTLVSVAVLGLGLCMGGFWAYETLGWGGFWAWDPVENVSFVPWTFAAALVHGLIVQVTRGRWIATNLLLAGIPFVLFVYGTFMTRSGFLDDSSVHSFAEMNRSALWILIGVMGFSLIAFMAVWLSRGLRLGKEARYAETEGVHREGAYRSSSLLLAALGVATAVGMSVPLIQALSGGKPKAVGEQSYHLILVWFFVPIMLLMAAGPFISWRGLRMRELLSRLLNIFSISLGVVGILMFIAKRSGWSSFSDPNATVLFPFGLQVPQFPWMLFLIWLTAFACLANLWRIVEMWKRGRSSIGAFIAHIGVATLMAGLIISRGFEQKSPIIFVRAGSPAPALDFVIDYQGKTDETNRYNRNNKLLFKVTGAGESFQAQPGQYYVPPKPTEKEDDQMTWPYIHNTLWHDIYFTTRELTSEGPPFPLTPGTSKLVNDVVIRYDRFEMKGPPGKKGTKMITYLTVTDQKGVSRSAKPYVEITDEGMTPVPEPLDDFLFAVPLGIRPDTKEAMIQLRYLPTAYAVQIFYKPMTILVWSGTAIMTFGGLLAAWNRRRPRTKDPEPTEPSTLIVEQEENAPATVA